MGSIAGLGMPAVAVAVAVEGIAAAAAASSLAAGGATVPFCSGCFFLVMVLVARVNVVDGPSGFGEGGAGFVLIEPWLSHTPYPSRSVAVPRSCALCTARCCGCG